MAAIITRAGKGSPLTNAEVDANFTNLNTDKPDGFLGSGPNNIPLNQLQGSLAYYDRLPAIAFANVAPTVASATSIIISAPVTFVSGTTAIETIAAPDLTATGGAQITLIPTGIFTTTTAGNIALATTAVVSRALTLTYDSATAKWYPSY
jgi:hypothetical protein